MVVLSSPSNLSKEAPNFVWLGPVVYSLVWYCPTGFHSCLAHIYVKSILESSGLELQSAHNIGRLVSKRPMSLAPMAIAIGQLQSIDKTRLIKQ